LVVWSTASYVNVPDRETTPTPPSHISHVVGREEKGGRTDAAGGEDVPGHDSNLAPSSDSRSDDSRAVGTHQPTLVLPPQNLRDLHPIPSSVSPSLDFSLGEEWAYSDFILLRDSLGDADDEGDLSLDSLDNSIGSKRRRNVNDSCMRPRLLHRLSTNPISTSSLESDGKGTYVSDGPKDGLTKVHGSSLLGAHSSHKLGSELQSFTAMERRLVTSEQVKGEVEGGGRRERQSSPLRARSERCLTVFPLYDADVS
jgi:hypothetical protein